MQTKLAELFVKKDVDNKENSVGMKIIDFMQLTKKAKKDESNEMDDETSSLKTSEGLMSLDQKSGISQDTKSKREMKSTKRIPYNDDGSHPITESYRQASVKNKDINQDLSNSVGNIAIEQLLLLQNNQFNPQTNGQFKSTSQK